MKHQNEPAKGSPRLKVNSPVFDFRYNLIGQSAGKRDRDFLKPFFYLKPFLKGTILRSGE